MQQPEHLPRREVLRRIGLSLWLTPGLASLIAACGSPPSAPSAPAAAAPTAPPAKTRIVVGLTQEPTSLDPTADATNAIAVCLRDNVYEGLVKLDQGGKLQPGLAQLPTVSSDGTTFTFKLASGVKWHDGSPLTAEDVKFSWDRARDPNATPKANPHLDYWSPVQAVDAVDPTTVKVTLGQYSDNWLFHMAAGSACIVSRNSFASNVTNPVGTGPFKYVAWNRGASLTLTRNDDYWGEKARLKDVEFRFISDPNAMNNALKAGDIDAMGQIPGLEQVAEFQQDPSRFQVLKGQPFGKTMVSVNHTSGPLQDTKVRQALYAAIDRKAWIDGIAAGFGVPIGSHATPNDGEPYYADMTGVNPYDPQRARQLLSDAGQSNLRLRLAAISSLAYSVRGAEILNSQLQTIGVTLDVQPMDFPRWFAEVFGGGQNYDLTIINHIEERDIGNYANPKYYWHYANPQVTEGLTRADAEPDETRRKALYTQVQQQLANDVANLWVYAANQLAVLKTGVSGWQMQGIAPSLFLGQTSQS
jgi:peptide/nickel transport system substrate-binding protein